MIEITFYDEVASELLTYSVILAKSKGKRIFCKHREHEGYEIPGGHIEPGETALEAAGRELYEETGAFDFKLEPLFVYSANERSENGVLIGTETYGMVYAADILSFEGELHCEIEYTLVTDTLPEKWAYPHIQPRIVDEAIRRGKY